MEARFEQIYREQFRFVWGAARRLGVPHDAVEDAVQDVFSTTYGKLDEIDAKAPIRPWLWGVTRRVASRHRRTAARVARRHAALASVRREDQDPSERHDAARWVERFLDTLEPAQRDTFVLAELLGMSAPEIAAQHAVPLNTVYSRLRLARRRLVALAQSPDHARRLLAHARAELEPPDGARHRTWIALCSLASSTPVAAASGLTLGGTGWIAAALAIAVGGLVSAFPTGSDRGPRPSAVTVAATSLVPATVTEHPPDVPAPRPPDAPAIGEPPPPAPARSMPGRQDDRPLVPDSATRDPTRLREELRLMDAARTALEGDDPTTALRWVDEHARRFAAGQLTDVRMATRVRALCALGRSTDAAQARDDLLHAFPHSNVARSEASHCR